MTKETKRNSILTPAPPVAEEAANASLGMLPCDAALLLDFDGTLAPLAPRPDSVFVPPYLPSLLLRVRGYLRGALGLVSGRPIRDLDRFTGWSVMAVAGVHGLERRSGTGTIVRAAGKHDARLNPVRKAVTAFRTRHPAVLVEDKVASLALHYRLVPEDAGACIALAETLAREADDLEAIQGDQVVEIKPISENKGTAVRAFLAEDPFKGRLPIFVGDDFSDEDAFAETKRQGGHAIIVGSRRPTLATHRFPTVQAVHAWLNSING
jgi:trehalose 6-phosphate phosphatase